MPLSESSEVRREITAQELGALLSGIDLSQAKRRKLTSKTDAKGQQLTYQYDTYRRLLSVTWANHP